MQEDIIITVCADYNRRSAITCSCDLLNPKTLDDVIEEFKLSAREGEMGSAACTDGMKDEDIQVILYWSRVS